MSLLTVNSDDTICAVATPPGKGGIAVIRVSGKDASSITRSIFPSFPETLESHQVYYGNIVFKSSDIDEVLVTYFEQGRSFTGEETCEISCHGSTTISNNILDALIESGCRIAEPGEFTYRAFMNQRIDLVQAEGVLDLIESETRRASNLALRQLKGGLSARVSKIEAVLTEVLAHTEANIDFAAEDIEIASNESLLSRLSEAKVAVDELLQTYRQGKAIHDGVDIAIVGEPNVGKSSLLNRLSEEDKAIVTDIAGTTRDVVESSIRFEGLKLNLFDTAGIRESQDVVENLGIDKTIKKMKEADLCFVVIDGSVEDPYVFELDVNLEHTKRYLLVNKMDLRKSAPKLSASLLKKFEKDRVFFVSAEDGRGIDELKKFVLEEFGLSSEMGQESLLTNSRHLSALMNTKVSIEKAESSLSESNSPDLVAFDLMDGLKSIQSVLGKQFDDEVLDQVFRQFCLGK